ncbi:MAG: ATP-binding protein [Alphaproteobacteria bacterium]|nr:ATP-binding protein [Alphaproteobacteria bacterium]
MWPRVKETFRNALGSVEEVGMDELVVKLRTGVTGSWQAKGRRVMAELAKADRPVVIFMDELPILVNRILKGGDYTLTPDRIQQADVFVSFLRAATIQHQGRIVLVVAGSIGMGPVLRQAGLSATLNTLATFCVEPWSEGTAKDCLDALARNYNLTWEAGAKQEVVNRLGCAIPHHVQMYFDFLLEERRRSGSTAITVGAVGTVYRTKMLSSQGHGELSHFEERLKMVLGPALMPLAIDLLTETAKVGVLSPEAASLLSLEHLREPQVGHEALREVLSILEHDGYLRRELNEYRFISTLLRDWWLGRFGFTYIPVDERRSAR